MQGKALLIHYASTARLEHPGFVSALTHKFLHTLDNIFPQTLQRFISGRVKEVQGKKILKK